MEPELKTAVFGCWVSNQGPRQEQQVLFNTKPKPSATLVLQLTYEKNSRLRECFKDD